VKGLLFAFLVKEEEFLWEVFLKKRGGFVKRRKFFFVKKMGGVYI
jgi:hypothetical protein